MAVRPIPTLLAGSRSGANALIESGLRDVRRVPFVQALRASTTHEHDFIAAYVGDLGNVVDFDAIRGSGVHLGVDPLGGSGVHYWAPIAERYGIDLTVVSDEVDSTFRFMTRGLGRQDPHGSFVFLRHAAPDRTERSVRRGLCLRHRS